MSADKPYCPPDGHSETITTFRIEIDRTADAAPSIFGERAMLAPIPQYMALIYGGGHTSPLFKTPCYPSPSEALAFLGRVLTRMPTDFLHAAQTGATVVPPKKE